MMIVRRILVLLLLTAVHVCTGQNNAAQTPSGTIRVKVLDAGNNQPIPYANVYISHTTIGGYTDDKGEIEIRKIPFGNHELVISDLGHKPLQRKLAIRGETTVYMTVKLLVRMLKEVEVNAKRDDKWNRQLARFEKLFLGSDRVKQCKIANPWVLEFKTTQGDFIAEAAQPLKIENDYLGYNLEFEIKTCVFGASKYIITGYARFEEKPGNDSLTSVWKRNRETTYRGSAQHFFRAVIDSTLNEKGYEIYSDISSNDDIVRGSNFLSNLNHNLAPASFTGRVKPTGNGMYTIAFPSRLEVHYLKRRAKSTVYRNVANPIGWMEVRKRTLTVSRNGIVQNPDDLVLSGDMSGLKVAEWLPLDYQYSERNTNEPVILPAIASEVLLEKPYIQTDRNYYYNRETIWFKGYMNYSFPFLKDTLSQSIYVELADNGGKVLITKRYPVVDGKFNGDIMLEKTFAPGTYQLKAFTAWMLNFDKKIIFTKTISLLGEKEAVRIVSGYKLSHDTLPNISIRTDKLQYASREKVTVTIDVTDSLDFPTASDLSISVTDLDQAVPLAHEKTILNDFGFANIATNDSLALINYNIEYGIDFNGTFWIGKKLKPVQASITIFQDNTTENFGIITDESGRFARSLSFNDTLNFYIRAMSWNNKKGIVVMDTLRPKCPRLDVDPVLLDVYSADASRHVKSIDFNSATLLKEVEIKAKKIEKAPSPAVIHGQGDYVVTGDWINGNNFTDLPMALAAKVPGLVMGPPLRLRTGMTGLSGNAPLIVIDGIAQMGADADLDILRDIPIRSIDRIDVLKYGASASYGSRAAGGVIAIYTKKGLPRDSEDKSFDKSKLQAVKWSGYSATSSFISPDYGKPVDNDYFDYRPTIYWSPAVTTNGKEPSTVSFYAADAVTKYRIVVEGLTAGGVPVRAEKIIEVVKGK